MGLDWQKLGLLLSSFSQTVVEAHNDLFYYQNLNWSEHFHNKFVKVKKRSFYRTGKFFVNSINKFKFSFAFWLNANFASKRNKKTEIRGVSLIPRRQLLYGRDMKLRNYINGLMFIEYFQLWNNYKYYTDVLIRACELFSKTRFCVLGISQMGLGSFPVFQKICIQSRPEPFLW